MSGYGWIWVDVVGYGPIRATSGSTFFSAPLSGHCFFVFLVTSTDRCAVSGYPECATSFPGECPKIDSAAKSLPGGPEAPKGCPEVAKCHQKRPQIDDFGAQKSLKWAESFVVSDDLQTAQRLDKNKKREHSPLFGKTLWGDICRQSRIAACCWHGGGSSRSELDT